MPFCPNCGASHDAGAKFCAGCGNALAASNPAPQNPVPQYQAPQYQQPVYQAPQYQQPVYQAPQYQQPPYQPNPYQAPQQINPAVDFAAMKKQNVIALILCAAALVFQIAAFIYLMVAQHMHFIANTWITTVIRFGICALFPFLAMRTAASCNEKSLKGNRTGVIIFLVFQIVGALLGLVSYFAMRNGSLLFNTLSSITSYIAGSNVLYVLMSMLDVLRHVFRVHLNNLLQFISAVLCWVSTILCLTSYNKKAKV